MIDRIREIALGAGFELVALIDHYALNVELDKTHATGKSGYYIMLPKQEERRYGDYDVSEVVRVELVATAECPFGNDDRADFENVNRLAEGLKKDLQDIIDAVLNTGEFENVSRISYTIIPYRYDSFQTAVTATFDLSRPAELC